MKFRKLVKKLATFGIRWDKRSGKGSHGAFIGMTAQTRLSRVFVIPYSQQREISKAYLAPLRRAFELTTEDGISDDEFYD